jgi:hypothetical protein
VPAYRHHYVTRSAHHCGTRPGVRRCGTRPRAYRCPTWLGGQHRGTPHPRSRHGSWSGVCRCETQPRVRRGLASLHPHRFSADLSSTLHPDSWSDDDEGRPANRAALIKRCVRRRPTLPRSGPRSTIGAERLSFRVRDGTGRFPLAMVAVTLWRFQSLSRP